MRAQATPGGVPGNSDYGTMEAHAVFGMLGFYPFSGMGYYALGSPTFQNVTITVPVTAGLTRQPAQLTVLGHNASATNIYVSKASMNGKPLATPFVTHQQLTERTQSMNVLEMWCGPTPTTFAAGAASPDPHFPTVLAED